MTREAKVVYTAEDRTGPATASVRKGVQSVAEVAALAGVSLASLGSAATLAVLTSMVKRINDGVDALNDLKDATGASIENISKLEHVAKLNGTSFDTVGQSLVKFNQALGSTLKPGTDAENVLKAIGLNAKALRDMDPAEALRQTAIALSRFADDGNKARATQELFGKSLREVAPFLKDLAEAGEINARVTTKQAEEAERFNKELFKMQTALGDVGRAIANPLVTAMNSLIGRFRDAKKEGAGFIELMAMAAQLTTPAGLAAYLTKGALGIGSKRNGYTTAREGVSTIEQALADPTLSASERAALVGQQTRYRQQLDGYLNSTAGAGRGMGGYEGVPRTSLDLPLDEKSPKGGGGSRAKASADDQIREARRVAEERQKLRIQEDEQIRKFQLDQRELAEKTAQAMIEAARKGSAEYLDSIHKNTLALNEEIAAVEWQIKTHGLSREAIQALTQARLDDELAMKLETAGTNELVDAAHAEYEAKKKLLGLQGDLALKDASSEAAKAAKQEWATVADSFVDNLMRGGKSVAQYLKDLFRTLVLRPILAPVGQALSGVLGSLLGGPSAGGGMLGGLGSIGQALLGGGGTPPNPYAAQGGGFDYGSSILNLGSRAIGGGAMIGGISNVASALGFKAFAGGMLGNAAPVASTAIGGVTTAAGAWGSAAAAAIPVIGWVVAIAGLLYSIFGKKKGGPKVGAYAGMSPGIGMANTWDSKVYEGLKTATDTLQNQYETLVNAFGGTANVRFGIGTTMDPRGKAPTFLGVTAERGGSTVARYQNYNVGRSQEELQAAMGQATAEILIKGLRASSLAQDITEVLDGVIASSKYADGLARIQKIMTERVALDERWFQMTATEAEKLQRIRENELKAIDDLNRLQLLRVHALEDEIVAQAKARAAMEEVKSFIGGIVGNIGGWLDRMNATPAGMLPPEQQLANAKAQFAIQLAQAKAGDRNALQNITGYGDQLISAQTAYTASGTATADTIGYVKSALGGLQSTLSSDEYLVTAIGAGADLVNDSIQTLIARADANAQKLYDAWKATQPATSPVASLPSVGTAPVREAFGPGFSGRFRYAIALAAFNAQNEGAVPAFADGGYHSGGWRVVGERGPELAYTGPERIFSNQQSIRMAGGGDPALLAEVRALREELRALRVISAEGSRQQVAVQERIAENTEGDRSAAHLARTARVGVAA